MSDILKYLRNIFGISSSDERNLIQNRKRRLLHDDYDYFSTKLRKLSDHKMSSNNYDEWTDFPSTSKTSFVKLGSRSEPFKRTMLKSLNQEVIDLSDDDDVIEVTPRHKFDMSNGNNLESSFSKPCIPSPNKVLLKARRTIRNCNKLFNDGNESIRLEERQVYRELLLNSPRTSAVYSNTNSIQSSTPVMNHSSQNSFECRTKKILQMLRDKRLPSVIDLTDDKSNKSNDPIIVKDDSDAESVGSKRKIDPVNSLKKVLDSEPLMNPNYLTKFEEMRIRRKRELEKEISEKRKELDLFSDANRENINLLLEVKLKNCKISDVVLLDDYSEEDELNFPNFTAEQEAKINEALKTRNPNKLFIEKYNLKITAHDLKTFNEKEWLNDEVINFYVNMIQERSEKKNLPSVYAFSTFFYPKLISSGYASLRRWTKRVDIFSYDIIVVPVHLGFHWCMATIDFRDKSIRYYDSMLGKNIPCLNALEIYLQEEHKDKKKAEYDTSDWCKIIMKDIPRQMNGSDCGVFSCTFAEFITRNAKILFTQEHMPYIRRKMVIEIIEGKLLT